MFSCALVASCCSVCRRGTTRGSQSALPPREVRWCFVTEPEDEGDAEIFHVLKLRLARRDRWHSFADRCRSSLSQVARRVSQGDRSSSGRAGRYPARARPVAVLIRAATSSADADLDPSGCVDASVVVPDGTVMVTLDLSRRVAAAERTRRWPCVTPAILRPQPARGCRWLLATADRRHRSDDDLSFGRPAVPDWSDIGIGATTAGDGPASGRSIRTI